MADHEPFDHSRIDDQVFIGTNACCQMHFDQHLLKQGVSADISLEEERLDMPFGVELFLWLPTPDHHAPERQKALVGIESLDVMLKQGRRVFIHCKNGHGRGPTFYAAYLIKKRGMSVEDAIAWVQRARPTIHLEPEQVGFLQSLTATA